MEMNLYGHIGPLLLFRFSADEKIEINHIEY